MTRRRVGLAVVLIVSMLLPVASAGASGDERDELARRLRELSTAREMLEFTSAVAHAELVALGPRVLSAEARLESARAELAAAVDVADRAAAAEAVTRAEIADLERLMAEMAVAAYVRPPQSDAVTSILDSSSPAHARRMQVYLDAQASRDTAVAERLHRTRDRLEEESARARAARRRADLASEMAALRLGELAEAQAEREVLVERVRTELTGVEVDAFLLAVELQRSGEDMVREATRRRDRGVTLPLVTVRGIRVHHDIARSLESLLAAAEADGIRLGGGGHRDNAAQIELRRRHCGDDDYAIWEMPPAQCSPPTARPGTSLHELGLAVDFTVGGRTITSRTDPAFVWLAAHAPSHGLFNLPSEPWHWSVSGG